jgi:ATP-dependent RNA helicase DeaD
LIEELDGHSRPRKWNMSSDKNNLPKNIQKFVKTGAPKRAHHDNRIKPNAPHRDRPEPEAAGPSVIAEEVVPTEIPPFSELGLSEPVLRAITELGFEIPTPIQARAIPALLAGRDMIGQAQTGTGKTAAFGLPMLQLSDPSINKPQALVLEPTRELAVQVAGGIHDLGKYTGLRTVPVYGGQPIDRQFRALSQGAHIVIGTPGRVLDHLRRGSLSLEHVKICVLDEADEMLALGFLEDVESILSEIKGDRQIAFFSATMPPRVAALTKKFQRNPEHIAIDVKKRTVESTSQTYYEVAPGKKLEALARVLDMESPGPTMVFCRTRQDTNDVAEALRLRGYNADALNGEMNQSERDRVLKRFRDGQSDLLVATDVAARGLDIDTVTHVVNFDIPWDVEQYIHRIGRTGRAGRTGDAITLVEGRERRQLKFIEQMIGAKIRPARIPTASDIAARRRDQFLGSLKEALSVGTSDVFLETVESLTDDYSANDIAAAALQMLWKSQETGQFSVEEEIAAGEQPEVGMTRIFVGLGRQDGLRPGDLVGAITNEANISGKSIGAIDILDRTAFVEVPTPDVERVLVALRHTKLRGRKVKIDVAAPVGFN